MWTDDVSVTGSSDWHGGTGGLEAGNDTLRATTAGAYDAALGLELTPGWLGAGSPAPIAATGPDRSHQPRPCVNTRLIAPPDL